MRRGLLWVREVASFCMSTPPLWLRLQQRISLTGVPSINAWMMRTKGIFSRGIFSRVIFCEGGGGRGESYPEFYTVEVELIDLFYVRKWVCGEVLRFFFFFSSPLYMSGQGDRRKTRGQSIEINQGEYIFPRASSTCCCCCTSTTASFAGPVVGGNKPKTYFEQFTGFTRKRPAVIGGNAPCYRTKVVVEYLSP